MARFSSCTAAHCNKAFIKVRFAEQLHLANKSPGNRGEIVSVLLEYVNVGSNAHNQLIFAQIMDDDSRPLLEKLLLLWCCPK